MDNPLEMASNATTLLPNPYYPLDSTIPGYLANTTSVPVLLTAFFGACLALFSSTHIISKKLQPTLTNLELLTIMWFVLSGSIHIFFEGYYVRHFFDLASHQTFIGQMWKEYAFSDSRYLTQNAFVLCMEAITATCWGPACLLVAALVVLRHPLRLPLQMLVSLGQLYGDVLYYGTAGFEHLVNGVSFSRPEALYFWFYFVFMNAIWIVVPAGKCDTRESKKGFADEFVVLALIFQGVTRAANALASVEQMESSNKRK